MVVVSEWRLDASWFSVPLNLESVSRPVQGPLPTPQLAVLPLPQDPFLRPQETILFASPHPSSAGTSIGPACAAGVVQGGFGREMGLHLGPVVGGCHQPSLQ